jgi:hypothetical protein
LPAPDGPSMAITRPFFFTILNFAGLMSPEYQ